MSYLQEAFNQAIKDATPASTWYVCLVSRYQAYGGPEEGGWWYTVRNLEAYREYPSEELAEAAAALVKQTAQELSQLAMRAHGERCLQEMEWLDARGLDADWLPEPDGAEEYEVFVAEELPHYTHRRPQYE